MASAPRGRGRGRWNKTQAENQPPPPPIVKEKLEEPRRNYCSNQHSLYPDDTDPVATFLRDISWRYSEDDIEGGPVDQELLSLKNSIQEIKEMRQTSRAEKEMLNEEIVQQGEALLDLKEKAQIFIHDMIVASNETATNVDNLKKAELMAEALKEKEQERIDQELSEEINTVKSVNRVRERLLFQRDIKIKQLEEEFQKMDHSWKQCLEQVKASKPVSQEQECLKLMAA